MKLSTLALAGALALTGATASFAQPAAPDRAGERPGAMRMQRPDPAQRAERRAEHLRAALQLRPEQDAALRAFIDAQRPPEGAGERMRGQRQTPDQMAMGQMTTPQRLEQARSGWPGGRRSSTAAPRRPCGSTRSCRPPSRRPSTPSSRWAADVT